MDRVYMFITENYLQGISRRSRFDRHNRRHAQRFSRVTVWTSKKQNVSNRKPAMVCVGVLAGILLITVLAVLA